MCEGDLLHRLNEVISSWSWIPQTWGLLCDFNVPQSVEESAIETAYVGPLEELRDNSGVRKPRAELQDESIAHVDLYLDV